MEAFLEEHWLSILSLFVATFGGIPGVVAVLSYFKSSPKLSVRVPNYALGNFYFKPDPMEYTYIFFSVTISNKGERPLSPATIDLYVAFQSKWIKFQRRLIPNDVIFHSDEQEIHMKNPEKQDLQRYSGAISQGIPINGHLLFVTDKIILAELSSLDKIDFRFVCTDIFNKKHVVKDHLTPHIITENTVYPKHGVSVNPKKNP